MESKNRIVFVHRRMMATVSNLNIAFIFWLSYISITIVTGTIIVNIALRNRRNNVCTQRFKSTLLNPIVHDARPESIALGDFNNDNKIDIIIVNSAIDEISLLLGHDNGSFSSRITYKTSLGSNPRSIVVGDMNNDYRLDAIVAHFSTNSIGIYNGDGNGTIVHGMTIFLGRSRPLSLTVGDFNNDSYLDIAVANYGTDDISLIFGYSNGTFTDTHKISIAYDSAPCSIISTDLNSDGHLDIITANYGTNTVGVFFGYGDGSFRVMTMLSTGIDSRPKSVAVADFNNDGFIDICVANFGTDAIGLWLGHGNGYFNKQQVYSTGIGSKPYSIAVGDFNQDHRMDICVCNSETDNIGIFLGVGNGTLINQTLYSIEVGSNPHAVAIADFNNDEQLDVAVLNYGRNSIHVFFNFDPLHFDERISYSTGVNSNPTSIDVGDINNDSQLDIVVANSATDNIGILLGQENGTFAAQITYTTGINSFPISVTLGDFNNDTYLDIAVVNWLADNVGIFIGHGNGSFITQTSYSTGTLSTPTSMALGDFNNDDTLDIVVTNTQGHNVGILFGYGDGSFATQVTYTISNDCLPISVAVNDVNRDNALDLIIVNLIPAKIDILFGHENGSFSIGLSYFIGTASTIWSIGVGDFNNDSWLDFALPDFDQNQILLLFGNSNGSLVNRTAYSTGIDTGPYAVVINDLNNDHRLDIVVVNLMSNNLYVYLGYGNGNFSNPFSYFTGQSSSPRAAVLCDINNDRRLDIVTANFNVHNIDVRLSNQYGRTRNQVKYFIGSYSNPHAVNVNDINMDNQTDIVVTNYGTHNIDIFLGSMNGDFVKHSMISTGSGSAPISTIIGDINGDIYLDIITANYGSHNVGVYLGNIDGSFRNESYYDTGDRTFPIAVALANFNKENWLNFVVVTQGNNKIGVFIPQNSSTFSMAIKYSTDQRSSPCSIAVSDFNNDQQLDIVIVNKETYTLGIFMGYGNGSFATQKVHPVDDDFILLSMGVGDFNNDDYEDLVVTSSEGNNIKIYLGYGNGTFAIPTTYFTGTDSGPYFVAVGDLNNDHFLDLVVVNRRADAIAILFGNGDGIFTTPISYSTGDGSRPESAVVGDFNNDKVPDIAVANTQKSNIGILLGCGNGTYCNYRTHSIGSESGVSSLSTGDLNNDGNSDIVVAISNKDLVGILIGDGNGSFANLVTYSTGVNSFPLYVAVGYFNLDTNFDIIVANVRGSNIGIFFGNGDGSFSPQMSHSTGTRSNPCSIAVGHFNKDELLDFAVTVQNFDEINVFLGVHVSTIEQKTFTTGSYSNPTAIAVGDFNSDTQPDAVVAHYGTDTIGIFLGNDNTIFSKQMTYHVGKDSHPFAVAIGDFNNDARLDIVVVGSGSTTVNVFLGYGDGTFAKHLLSMSIYGFNAYSLVVADLNEDYCLDLAIANYGSNSVSILYGNGDGYFGNEIMHSLGYFSHPYSIAAGDLNNDKRLDIVVANSGTNNEQILWNIC